MELSISVVPLFPTWSHLTPMLFSRLQTALEPRILWQLFFNTADLHSKPEAISHSTSMSPFQVPLAQHKLLIFYSPDILKKYNPNLFGYSNGIGSPNVWEISRLNVAMPGANAKDLPGQARQLVALLQQHTEVFWRHDDVSIMLFHVRFRWSIWKRIGSCWTFSLVVMTFAVIVANQWLVLWGFVSVISNKN